MDKTNIRKSNRNKRDTKIVDRKTINARKSQEIEEAISTTYGRMKLYVDTWFPMDRIKYNETEEQRVNRLFGVLGREAEEIEMERKNERN